MYLCVLCGPENKQRLFQYTASADASVKSNEKLLPATITFSCTSVRVELFDPLWKNYREILQSGVLEYVKKN
jgi:hypothetical protein